MDSSKTPIQKIYKSLASKYRSFFLNINIITVVTSLVLLLFMIYKVILTIFSYRTLIICSKMCFFCRSRSLVPISSSDVNLHLLTPNKSSATTKSRDVQTREKAVNTDRWNIIFMWLHCVMVLSVNRYYAIVWCCVMPMCNTTVLWYCTLALYYGTGFCHSAMIPCVKVSMILGCSIFYGTVLWYCIMLLR